jgi:hypothetical protein
MANSNRKICKTLPKQTFDYHSRKCVICRHPDRAAIEEEFVYWGGVWDIARIYQLGDYRSLYRHAHATGLTLRRRENLHSVLDIFLEKARGANMSGDSILRAIRAYSCVAHMGRWVDPPTQMNYSIATGAPAPAVATAAIPTMSPVTPAPHVIAPAHVASAQHAEHVHAANSTSQRSTVIDLDLDENDDADENDEPDVNDDDNDPVEADEDDETEDVDLDEDDETVEADENDENEDTESPSDSDDDSEPDDDSDDDSEPDGESALETDPVPALKTHPVAKSKPVPQPAPAPSALPMNSALTMKTAAAPNAPQTPPPFHPAVTNPAPTYGTLTDAGQINGGAIRMACIPLKTNNGDPFRSTVKPVPRPAHFARRFRRRK